MWSGTERIGLMTPCSTRPSIGLWQRLYLRPLPHQHSSLASGGTVGGKVATTTTECTVLVPM